MAETENYFAYNMNLQRPTPSKHITARDEKEYTYIPIPNNFTMKQLNSCIECANLLQCKMTLTADVNCFVRRIR